MNPRQGSSRAIIAMHDGAAEIYCASMLKQRAQLLLRQSLKCRRLFTSCIPVGGHENRAQLTRTLLLVTRRRKMPRTKKNSPPRVEVLVGSWKQYGRGIIEGVWRYAQKHGPWLIHVDPSEADERTRVPSGMAVDGIIALIHTKPLAKKLRACRVPVVNVSGAQLSGVTFPRVTSDAQAVVRMAIEHLKERGFTTIAFCGEPHRHFIDYWQEAYVARMKEEGLQAFACPAPPSPHRRASENTHQQYRQRWLEGLPKPVGVIGWDTVTCRHLALACAEAGFDVPDQVAILGLESDDLLGRVVHPPISGVDIPVEMIGYEAARILGKLLRNRSARVANVRIPPLGVVTRQSTDAIAVSDPKLKEALRFIREHAHEGIAVGDVLEAVPMARRTLERCFREALGRSPAEDIRWTKIQKVRALLISTDMSIPDVAKACGFNYVEHMIPVFRKYHGTTPSRFRRQSRAVGRDRIG